MLDGLVTLFLLAALAALSLSVTVASKMVAIAAVIFSGLYFLNMMLGVRREHIEKNTKFTIYMKRPDASFSYLAA